jgi:hypothetical protein
MLPQVIVATNQKVHGKMLYQELMEEMMIIVSNWQ